MSEKTPMQLLKEKADLMGLTYKSNISQDKLRELVNKVNEPKEEVAVVKSPKKLTDEEKAQEELMAQRKEMTKLQRVIITSNDPAMLEWDTTPILHVSNSVISLPRIAIPLNVPWLVPNAYLVFLKEQTCGIPSKGKDSKNRPVTIRRTIAKYNIQPMGDLTVEELKELKQSQAMRDGVAQS